MLAPCHNKLHCFTYFEAKDVTTFTFGFHGSLWDEETSRLKTQSRKVISNKHLQIQL